MCRIHVNFSITLREVVSVLTGDYPSTYVRVLQYFRKSTGEVLEKIKLTNHIFQTSNVY